MIVVTVAAEGDAEADAPGGPVRPDADAIFALINVWDHRCPEPYDCPHGRGPATRFAHRTGRHRQSLWNLRAPGKLIGPAFIVQIADTLHVPWQTLVLPDDGEVPGEDPQPRAEAA
jgi:hypothetical protein